MSIGFDAFGIDGGASAPPHSDQYVEPPTQQGLAICSRCGARCLDVRIEDGRRFPFEVSDDGEFEIVGDVARPRVGGEFAIHNCRRIK